MAALLLFSIGFSVREYVLAPNNFINQMKARHAFEKTQGQLLATYQKEGRAGVARRCAQPIETNGYWFTCDPSNHFSYRTWLPSGQDAFFVAEVGLFRWRSKIEAEEIAMFRQSLSWRHSTVYRLGGEGLDPAYYLDSLSWADSRFVTLEERLAIPEDFQRETGGYYP